MEGGPEGIPTQEELAVMEFCDITDLLDALADFGVNLRDVNMNNAATDRVISFHVGRIRINTKPDDSGKMRFTPEAVREILRMLSAPQV